MWKVIHVSGYVRQALNKWNSHKISGSWPVLCMACVKFAGSECISARLACGRVCNSIRHVQWPCAPRSEVLLPYNSEFFWRTRCVLTWWSLYGIVMGMLGGVIILIGSFCWTISKSMSASILCHHTDIWEFGAPCRGLWFPFGWHDFQWSVCGQWCQISQVLFMPGLNSSNHVLMLYMCAGACVSMNWQFMHRIVTWSDLLHEDFFMHGSMDCGHRHGDTPTEMTWREFFMFMHSSYIAYAYTDIVYR